MYSAIKGSTGNRDVKGDDRVCTAMLTVVLLACVTSGFPINETDVLPGYFHPCHQNDPQLNGCIRDSLNILIRNLKSGVEELQLPSVDPLELPLIDLGVDRGNLSLQLTLKNNIIRGITHTTVTSVKASLADYKLEVVSKTPFFEVEGEFMCEGAVLTFPLHSTGNYFVNMTDVTAVWIVYYHELTFERGGPSHFKIDDFRLDIVPTDIKFQFGQELDGDNSLGEAMDTFLNGNSHEIFNYVKPRVTALLGNIFSEYADAILASLPADSIFPEK